MVFLVRLTHDSLATIIAWVSTCLLAGGASTLFSETARMTWLIWGCFGLAAAIGLDVAARLRERLRMDKLKLAAVSRFERDMNYEYQENEANAAVREAVARIFGRMPPALRSAASRRSKIRIPCDVDVELHPRQDAQAAAGNRRASKRKARITNLSECGFELTLTEPLRQQRMELVMATANGGRQTMLGEVLWCCEQPDETYLAGGRFLNVLSVEGD